MTPSVIPLLKFMIASFFIVDTIMTNITPAMTPVSKCITIPSVKLR